MIQEKGSKSLDELIEEVADLIVNAKKVVVFTGAGISTESGIPDFRGPDGLWTKFDPEDFTYQKYVTSSEARKRLWGMSKTAGLSWTDLKPNAAHYAVAELERLGKLDCVITQNVDGLHQKAGNSEDKVIQLHGNMQWAKCLSCGERWRNEEVMRWVEAGAEDPMCVKCGGIIKPEGVFFGEAMPVRETMEAEQRSSNCDLCIVIGSSLVVYPAAMMPQYALQSGAKLVIINEGETSLDHVAHIRIDDKAGKVMPEIVKRVKKKLKGRGNS
jgi:NAD-dependent deacetylase